MPDLSRSPEPSRASKTSNKPKAARLPSRLYLRDAGDLTLHGGIDACGDLVVFPLISGLGLKGFKPADYLRQVEALWADGALQEVLREVGWDVSQTTVYRGRCPALNTACPLPSASVIDRVLSEDSDVYSRDVARDQLARVAARPSWRVYRGIGTRIENPRQELTRLLDVESRKPGLLSQSFHALLQLLGDLYDAIDRAVESHDRVALSRSELHQILSLSSASRRPFDPNYKPSKNWSAYLKKIVEEETLAREALADPKILLGQAHGLSLREELSKSGIQRWILIPELGASRSLEFAQGLASNPGFEAFWPEGVTMERESQGGYTYQRSAKSWAISQSLRMSLAVEFVWKQIVNSSPGLMTERHGHALDTALADARSRRFSDTSSLAVAFDQFPSRPIAEGGTLLLRRDLSSDRDESSSTHKTGVVIEPKVLRPHVAAIPENRRVKKYPGLHERFEDLPSLRRESGEPRADSVLSFYADESRDIIWPHGRVWQTVDFLKTLLSFPELFLCPEVLAKGRLHLSSEQWEALESTIGPEALTSAKPDTWLQVYDWLLGVCPWTKNPLSRMYDALDYTMNSRQWPIEIVDGGIAAADVRLSVRFIYLDAIQDGIGLESLAQLIASRKPTMSSASLLDSFAAGLRFEAKPYFEVEGQAIEESEWFGAVKTKSGFYRLASGMCIDEKVYLAKTDQFILRKRVYAKFQNISVSDIWRIHQLAIRETAASLEPEDYIQQLALRIMPVLEQLDAQILDPLGTELLQDSLPDLQDRLRPYQKEGLAWGFARFRLGHGVCLADEMGLGKTLQAIALLRVMNDKELPSLVVAPKTLLENWKREFERFGQDLRVVMYGEQDLVIGDSADIYLTSYPRLRLDQDELTRHSWNLVILDEAHIIKNAGTQINQVANRLKSRHRMALTGTPVENKASELWSLIDWLNPGYLGSQNDFLAYLSMARLSEHKNMLLAPLRECLSPIVLRRVKTDAKVALGLPDKVHLDLSYELSQEQSVLYEAVLETVLGEDVATLEHFAQRARYMKALLHLKQICIHPELFLGSDRDIGDTSEVDAAMEGVDLAVRRGVEKRLREKMAHSESYETWLARSGKLTALAGLLEELMQQSRGILIFTQYLGAAQLVRRVLDQKSRVMTPFIHGGLSTRERLEIVDEFNESCQLKRSGEAAPILILSLKTGGSGLNITGADRVIHLDRWWNPAVEDQATDRAHRIGQDRTVFAHTLTAMGTIEESIHRIFEQKRSLAIDLLGGTETETLGDTLVDREGFLALVDPSRRFTPTRLEVHDESAVLRKGRVH
jgi:superfamily II DNA or RNA helicase